jgi:hypothetical protein
MAGNAEAQVDNAVVPLGFVTHARGRPMGSFGLAKTGVGTALI